MEKEKSEERKLTMFDFIGEDNSIYDFLGKYAEIDDYSYLVFLKWIKKYATVAGVKNVNKDWFKKTYTQKLEDLMEDLRKAISINEPAEGIKPLNAHDRTLLLFKLQEIEPYREKFQSVGQYMDLLKNKISKNEFYTESGEIDAYNDKLSEVLLEQALNVTDKDKLADEMESIFNMIVPTIARNRIRGMKLSPEEEATELEKLRFIEKILRKPAELKKYNELLDRYYKEMAEHREKVALRLECETKREEYVRKGLYASLPEQERIQALKTGLESVIFRKSDGIKQKEGTFSWGVDFAKEPEIILDTMSEYSNNGIENQRVVAIDYGKFRYDTIFKPDGRPAFSSDNLHVVGVTRIGKDGVKNYFVITPLDEMKIKKSSELEDEDKKVSFKYNGEKQKITGYLDFDEYVFVKAPKIPEQDRDFCTKILFSDYILETATKDNYRFAGRIKDTQFGKSIDASDSSGAYDLWAIMYAYNHPGRCGKVRVNSIEQILNNSELLLKHMKNVQALHPDKTHSDNVVINETGTETVPKTFNEDGR